jgi:Domain of unknown function (DUF4276)
VSASGVGGGLIVPIVEGQSEERSIGVVLRRLLHEQIDAYDIQVARPFRVKRNRVVREGELERSILQAERSRAGASAIMILLDADIDCPATLGDVLRNRASKQTSLRVSVVLPKVETEAWILAGIESVRGVRGIRDDAVAPDDPEQVRDAKGALSALMTGSRGYVATDDQPAFFSQLDLNLVASRSPSFAKFSRDLTAIVAR